MPRRNLFFANNEIYHLLNRSINQSPIFTTTRENQRFLELINFYRNANPPLSFSHYNRLSIEEKADFLARLNKKEKLVEIFAYCLMPNHFHLLAKQLSDRGIQKMLSNIQNGYVRFHNLRNKRKGPLFESAFKAIRIENEEQFLHVSRYIHLNPSSSYLVKIGDLLQYPWSSFPDYLTEKAPSFTNPNFILNLIGNRKNYEEFVLNQAAYQRELDIIKHLALEEH
ncbi:MAG: transposase [bacterium]|nr:transposase [bacterium]